MKAASAPLIALMATGIFDTWDLYQITLVDGLVLNITSADFDVIDTDATLYKCGTYGSGLPRIDSKSARVTASIKAGLDPDQWQVYVMPKVTDDFTGTYSYPDKVGGTPWISACRFGLFDGATVQVKRAYFAVPPTYPLTPAKQTCVGSTIEFVGYLGQLDANNVATVFSFTGWGGLLNQSMPRNLYQSSCNHQLFDFGCTLSAAAYVKAGVALVGSSNAVLLGTVAAPAGSGTFTLGQVQFTSGQNNGFKRLVTSWDGIATFNFYYPLPFPISAGDTFNAWPGCDKSLGPKGCGGFANTINNNGDMYIPLPEVTIG